MDKKRVGQIKEQFDLVIHSDENAKIEFWFARELMSRSAMDAGKTLTKQSPVQWIHVICKELMSTGNRDGREEVS